MTKFNYISYIINYTTVLRYNHNKIFYDAKNIEIDQ